MNQKPKGKLIIVGGHEGSNGDQVILEEVCRQARERDGAVVIVTVATQEPEKIAKEYTDVFKELGVKKIKVLDIREREQAYDQAHIQKLNGTSVVFFTGGDQLRITSQIGDSLVFLSIKTIFEEGGCIVGTSAGAAAMPETMLISGPGDESGDISTLGMAPGLALISGVVVDSHFAQRGRMGRLLGAVAQNPRNLGLGIDEDTAIIVEQGEHFKVIGSGAVYVVDGTGISYSSLSEKNPEGIISIYDVKLHVLDQGDCFDLVGRRPIFPEKGDIERESTGP